MNNMYLPHVLVLLRCTPPPLGRRLGRADHSSTTAALLLYQQYFSSTTTVPPELGRAQPPYRSLIGLYYGVLWGGTVKKKKILNGAF